MPAEATQRQFQDEVFPAELEEINARRRQVGLEEVATAGVPSADRGLLGLALSGGGIRSATFALGVIEAAANTGLLKRADYLSTVSGGGYLGSCLSSVMNDPNKEPQGRAFPFHHELGINEPAAFRHLRNGSNYLAPGGLLNKLRLPALLVRGLLLNLVLFLPLVMLAVELTELSYELGSHSPVDFRHAPVAAIALFLLMTLTFPIVARVFKRRMGWRHRDRYERVLTFAFGLSALLLVLLPLSLAVTGTAEIGWENIRAAIVAEIAAPFEGRDYWKWLIALAALGVVLLIGGASERATRWSGKIVLYLAGLVGPLLLFALYLALCAYQIDSPFISAKHAEPLDRSEITVELRAVLASRGVELGPGAAAGPAPSGDGWRITDGDDEHRILRGRRFLRIEDLDLWDGSPDIVFFSVWVGLLLFNLLFLDVNTSSPHGFYRDRLSRVFLFRVDAEGAVTPNDRQKLSELNQPGTKAPYHLINAALNLHASKDPDLRGRKSDFFVFGKRYSGSPRTGYCDTGALERVDAHLDLGTAMAISGAAAAPNMGVTTVPSLVFLMTLLNIRLGYWLPNPALVRRGGFGRLRLFGGAGPLRLLRESVGGLDETGALVNISDGGHLENLAVYELLRRHCSFIVSIDAGADPDHRFRSLVELVRFAKIDMGIMIDIDLSALEKDGDGLCKNHWALGTIRYGPKETGNLLYVKASLTGDENLYVGDYAASNPLFPHQSTANQFFSETQSEAYRALGYHAARRAIDANDQLAELAEMQPEVAAGS